jgi:anthranilate phosphoribosyltransferase
MSQPVYSPTPPGDSLLVSIIQRVATGPELSKGITAEEARGGMRLLLEGLADPVQAAVFLIGLRMKRETMDEYKGILDAIRDHSEVVEAPVDEVIDLGDPYDGYNRTLPASTFLPAALAACGLSAVIHGLETVSPKYGLTHRQILRAAGLRVDLTPAEAAARLGDAALGWAYLDLEQYCPAAHRLIPLRNLLIKRQAMTTVEVSVGPIRGRRATHQVTGYVHKPYPPIYAELAAHAGFSTSLLIRGVEGGVTPSLRNPGKAFFYRAGIQASELDTDPTVLGIHQEVRATPVPAGVPMKGEGETRTIADLGPAAQAAVQAGLAALGGTPGPLRDGLVYTGALCLYHHGGAATLAEGAARLRRVLDDGSALARFHAALRPAGIDGGID